jgi:hypothetical protein
VPGAPAVAGSTLNVPGVSGDGDLRIVEDFTPLHESLEWVLQRAYYDRVGASAFIGGDVPFTATSGGQLSRDAAAILAASLGVGGEAPVRCLELGPGSGLFAKLLLDELRRLRDAHGVGAYERVTLVLADSSRAMLDAIEANRVLAGHEGHYELVHSDPGRPEQAGGGGELHAVFLNYVLDSLPASVVRRGDAGPEQLCARTRVAPGAALADYTELSLEDLVGLSRAGEDGSDRAALADVFGALVVDVRYEPVGDGALPEHAALADALPGRVGDAAVHGHGAIACLHGLAQRLAPGGVILVNDFGSSVADGAVREASPYPVYGGAIAIGLNYAQLDRVLGTWPGIDVHAPDGRPGRLVSRLIGHCAAPAAVAAFAECLDEGLVLARQRAKARAAELVSAREVQPALAAIAQARELAPADWTLSALAASFLAYVAMDREAARAEADRGLQANPLCTELWNVLGDLDLHARRPREALASFERAIALNPAEVHGRYNASYALSAAGDHAAALRMIAEALALDDGAWREKLLAKQDRILERLARRREADRERVRERIRPSAG